MNESVDLDFTYDDSDIYSAEIAELYSYTEECEFDLHKTSFYDALKTYGFVQWEDVRYDDRVRFVEFLQNELEMVDLTRRDAAVHCLLYLVQGVFSECLSDADQISNSRANIFLLCELGLFTSCIEVLAIEIDAVRCEDSIKVPVSLADSSQLRYILNILYTIVETMRWRCDEETAEQNQFREQFLSELSQPFLGEELPVLMLFNMVTRFCSGSAPHFPMKKVLLLLWKLILITLGGVQKLQTTKEETRSKKGLPPLPENSHEVSSTLRSCSPPANATDLIEQQMPRRSYRSARRDGLMKQAGLDEQLEAQRLDEDLRLPTDDDLSSEIDIARSSDDDLVITPPRPSTPSIPHKALPWKPKVRKKDLEGFLDATRIKFVGFNVKNDIDSLAGLPQPIHEGVKIIKQYLYTSLSELQIQEQDQLTRNPLSMKEQSVNDTPTERLYQALLPSLPQHMIALLKVLLAAAPTSKAKSDSINVLSDVLPAEMPSIVVQSMKLGLDVNRHKEIIVKAVSAILLLLLKHFKLNHVYQFEYMSQHLVFANCIPLVLKFFNQNIVSYVSAKNNINMIDFPYCVIGEPAELTAENMESGELETFCWRNIFSCINLLRILNKLTKWKHSRTMMLVVFKSAPILKRALKVRHGMMQLYILKLLKMQTKYLGRQWRKSNMKTMSAIYQNVRHRLNDDWAYGNDIDARPWDFQSEECALRTCVDQFNSQRYTNDHHPPDFQPVDNCLLSVLGQHVELTEEFQENYEKWLEMEVFSDDVDWDRVLMT